MYVVQFINLEKKDKTRLYKIAEAKGYKPAVAARLMLVQKMDEIDEKGWEI